MNSAKIYEHVVLRYYLVLPLMYMSAAYVYIKKAIVRGLFGKDIRMNLWFVDGISTSSKKVEDGAAGWRALDVVYNFKGGCGNNAFVRAVDAFWLRMRNAQAVRNRLVVVKQELTEIIEGSGNKPIKILSLAAGAAQGVIEVVSVFVHKGRDVQVVLIDRDISALEHARILAKEHGITSNITTIQGDVVFFERYIGDFTPDIVEMCGLLDYLRTSLAVKLIRKIHRLLNTGGVFLTCHVHPNGEAYFLKHVVHWDMLYRPVEDFMYLLECGNFPFFKLKTEPHWIHTVAAARK